MEAFGFVVQLLSVIRQHIVPDLVIKASIDRSAH